MGKSIFNKALKILLSTNGLVLLAGAMLGPIYALFVEDIEGSLLDASIAGGLFALAAGITTIISGRYTDKIKEKEFVMIFGYIIMGIGFSLYIFVESIIFLFIVQIIIGIGEAIYSPAFDHVYSCHETSKNAGTQWAAWEAMDYFVTALGAALGGFIVTLLGFNAMFLTMTFLCFISALYILFLPRKTL